MQTNLIYRRPLEIAGTEIPQWTWPVTLSDGRVILTLLYYAPRPDAPRTKILELSATGEARPWPPGLGYPAPVIFYANTHNELFGVDLIKTGKIYVCLPDGTHRWSLETTIRQDTPIAPTNLLQRGDTLFWTQTDGTQMTADVGNGTPRNIRKMEPKIVAEESLREVHSPYRHVTADGSIFVLDFTPTARISRYSLS